MAARSSSALLAPDIPFGEQSWYYWRKEERQAYANHLINCRLPELMAEWQITPSMGTKFRGPDLPKAESVHADTHQSIEKPWVHLMHCDTLHAALVVRRLDSSSKVVVLSFANDYRPGGRVFEGSSSQEGNICMRTTLLSTLNRSFYPLHLTDLIYSRNVFCFGLEPTSWDDPFYHFHVDVISCVPPRDPEKTLVSVDGESFEDYKHDADRELMKDKLTYILRAACVQGANTVVLGAFGCGGLGNPPRLVAQLMRDVLLRPSTKDVWTKAGIKKVIIAVFDPYKDDEPWNTFKKVFEPEPTVVVEKTSDVVCALHTGPKV